MSWGKLILAVVVYWALNRYLEYLNFPLPTHTGIDWGYHFSWTNYLIDIIFWLGVIYAIYRFAKPSLKNKKVVFLVILFTLILTATSFIFESPLTKTSYFTGTIIREVNLGLQCNNRTDDLRGLPYDYYHRWYCYNTSNQLVWDYVEVYTDYLILDAIFYFMATLIIFRIINLSPFRTNTFITDKTNIN